MATPQQHLEAINRLSAQGLGVLKNVLAEVTYIANNLKSAKGGGGGPGAPKGKAGGLFDGLKQFAKGLAVVTGTVAVITAALLAVPLAVLGIVSASEKFVNALNPALVQQYEFELRNLQATIGYGLTPVIQYAVKSVKEWAGILLPTIEKLRPVVAALSESISGAASGVVRLFGQVLQGVIRTLTVLMPAIRNMIDAVGAVFEILTAFLSVLQSVDGGLQPVVDTIKSFGSAVRAAAVYLGVLAAKLAGAISGAEGIAKFRKALADAIEARKNPGRGLFAAPQDAQITGIEDIGKQMSARAFAATAGGAGAEKSETKLLEEILANTAGLEPENWQDVIKNAVKEGIQAARDEATRLPTRQEIRDRIRNTDVSASASAALAVLNLPSTLGGLLGDLGVDEITGRR